jgi:RNA 3'-terminal phosphate cyclase (ATP)
VLIAAQITPIKKWKKLKLNERGEAMGLFGKVLNAHLARDIVD